MTRAVQERQLPLKCVKAAAPLILRSYKTVILKSSLRPHCEGTLRFLSELELSFIFFARQRGRKNNRSKLAWRLLKNRPLFPKCVNQLDYVPSKHDLLDEITYGQDKSEL